MANEKLTAILQQLPTDASPEIKVVVDLMTLLITSLSSELSSLKDIVNVQKNVTDRLVNENKRLQQRNRELDERLSYIEHRVDENEQHDRNVNLLLKGIPEVNGNGQGGNRNRVQEDTTKKFIDAVNRHFDPQNHLKMDDIARSHRLGGLKKNGKPRPIIARFVRETKKMDTYRVKKKLKGTGISLAENLTSHRTELFNEACDKLGYRNVWTWEGRIFTFHNGKRKHIEFYDDIPGYEDDDARSQDLFED
jgi:regulator of replication initiation timing